MWANLRTYVCKYIYDTCTYMYMCLCVCVCVNVFMGVWMSMSLYMWTCKIIYIFMNRTS